MREKLVGGRFVRGGEVAGDSWSTIIDAFGLNILTT